MEEESQTDIVFTYTITAGMMKEYGSGMMNHAASAMEHLADHYGIPSVCFGPRVAVEVKAGRLVMSLGEVPTAVPKETPDRDRLLDEELKAKGQTLFAKDGVHPARPGHEFYLKSVVAAFRAMRKLPPVSHAAFVGKPFFDGTFAAAKMVPVSEEMCCGEWRRLPPDDPNQRRFERRGGQMWLAEKPGSKLCFRFKGTECRIYDLLGPDCAQVWITVDGKRMEWPTVRFDAYCTYYRLASLNVFSGADGVHTVEIEVDSDQPSREPIHTRKPDEDLSQKKYDGTKFFPCQIMLVGDIVAMPRHQAN